MGGCFKEENPEQLYFSNLIDSGKGLGNLEINVENNPTINSKIALHRVIKHRNNIIKSNPCDSDLFDLGLRASLTYLLKGDLNKVDDSSAVGLRFLRDRISVPRDMPIIAARLFRNSLEKIASLCNSEELIDIPTQNRYDQNPINFIS